MDERREAPEVGLLSLPDELLTKIAKTTHSSKFDEGYRAWACAASTCKRLRDVQLSSISRVKHWTSETSFILAALTLQPWRSYNMQNLTEVLYQGLELMSRIGLDVRPELRPQYGRISL